MGIMAFEQFAEHPDIFGWLICFGIPLIGASLMALAVCYALYCEVVRRRIEAASVRVLAEYPEFGQTKEDFRAFTRKLLRELGWNSVTFTFN